MKGLNVFMTQLLPSVDWTDQYYPSFNNILSRLLKLFKYLQRASVREIDIIVTQKLIMRFCD